MNVDESSATVNSIGLTIFAILGSFLVNSALKQKQKDLIALSLVYFLIGVVFFLIQISYHFVIRKGEKSPTLQRIDRGSMLFLITAIFIPLLYAYAPRGVFIGITIVLSAIAVTGMIMMLEIKDLSRKLAPVLGFLMGIIGIATISAFSKNMTTQEIFLFSFGVIFLLGSGAAYALKKPALMPEVFGFHEFFHSFLIIGIIILHFLVNMALLGN